MGKLRLGHLSLSLLNLHAFELGGERPDGVGLGRHIGPAILISRWTWVCLHTETDIICSAVGGGKVGEYLGGACQSPSLQRSRGADPSRCISSSSAQL